MTVLGPSQGSVDGHMRAKKGDHVFDKCPNIGVRGWFFCDYRRYFHHVFSLLYSPFFVPFSCFFYKYTSQQQTAHNAHNTAQHTTVQHSTTQHSTSIFSCVHDDS